MLSHSRIMCSALSRDSTDYPKDLGTLYNKTLSKILDRHALLVTKTFIERPLIPWYNDGGPVRGNPATSHIVTHIRLPHRRVGGV